MKYSIPFVAALVSLSLVTGLDAQSKKKKVKPCVSLAKTWDAAVEEAKLLNVPIVLHSHGFYCPPCWGMHASVMQNKKYIKFAKKYTVEVCTVSRLQEGIQKKDRRAATYEDVGPDGQKKEYLEHWPGMTVQDMNAIRQSPASRYNKTGKIPYTCIVDPFTLKEIKAWSGSASAKTLMEEVKGARKALVKEHGAGVSRKALGVLSDAEATLPALIEKGDYAGAAKTLAKAAGRGNPPKALEERIARSRKLIDDAARKAFDAAQNDVRALTKLVRKLRGTGVEKDAKAALAELKRAD